MAARDAEGDNEAGDEQMDDDWAGALPAAAAGQRLGGGYDPGGGAGGAEGEAGAGYGGRRGAGLGQPAGRDQAARRRWARVAPRARGLRAAPAAEARSWAPGEAAEGT